MDPVANMRKILCNLKAAAQQAKDAEAKKIVSHSEIIITPLSAVVSHDNNNDTSSSSSNDSSVICLGSVSSSSSSSESSSFNDESLIASDFSSVSSCDSLWMTRTIRDIHKELHDEAAGVEWVSDEGPRVFKRIHACDYDDNESCCDSCSSSDSDIVTQHAYDSYLWSMAQDDAALKDKIMRKRARLQQDKILSSA